MVTDGSTGFGPDRYGESFADVYDQWYDHDWFDEFSNADATAAFLERFGDSQRVLELGVGTGRISTPIANAGHWVVGIDASMAMLERFRSVERSVAVGADMAVLPCRDEAFDTVLVATNTLLNLHTEAGQQACFVESRRCLRLGGRMIVEAMIPGTPDPSLDRLVTTRSIDVDTAVLTATLRNDAEQHITGQHIEISNRGIRMRPWKIRYALLDQLDAMASEAGFRLGDRFENWSGDPVTETSSNAVSVYTAI